MGTLFRLYASGIHLLRWLARVTLAAFHSLATILRDREERGKRHTVDLWLVGLAVSALGVYVGLYPPKTESAGGNTNDSSRYQSGDKMGVSLDAPAESYDSPLEQCDLAADWDDIFLPKGVRGSQDIANPTESLVAACEKAIKLDDIPRRHHQRARVAEALGFVRQRAGDADTASKYFTIADKEHRIAVEGRYPPALFRDGEIHRQNKDYEMAKKRFESAMHGSKSALYEMAEYYLRGLKTYDRTKDLILANKAKAYEIMMKARDAGHPLAAGHPAMDTTTTR